MQWKMNRKTTIIDINLSEKINLENSNLEDDHKISRWSRIKAEFGAVQNDGEMSETVQGILDSKIISDSCMKILKDDDIVTDPTIIMNVRHEQIREKHGYVTPRSGWNIDIIAEAKSIMRREKIEEQHHKREMAIIERELTKFREELKQQKKKYKPTKFRASKSVEIPWNDNEFWTQIPAPSNSKEKMKTNQKSSPRRYRSLEILHNKNKSVRFGKAVVIDEKRKESPLDLEEKVTEEPIISQPEMKILETVKDIIGEDNISELSSIGTVEEIITENDWNNLEIDNESLKINSLPLKTNTDLCITAKTIENALEKSRYNKNTENLLRQNFLEWRKLTTNLKRRRIIEQKQKLENIKKESNVSQVDSFLSKLKQRKHQLNQFSKSSENLAENTIDLKMKKKPISAPSQLQYQNRFKAQEHIIALQKAKLADQERLIRELKFKKIVAETKESNQAACADIKETIKNVSRNLKPKTIGLQAEVQTLTKEIEAPLQIVSQGVPQFLQQMNVRAEQRAKRHREANERRKQREEMKRKEKEEIEQARRQEDVQEKLKRIEDLKQKRRQEKLLQIQLEKDKQIYKEKCAKADLHYRLYLLEKFGIRPFRKLLTLKYDNIMSAAMHYNNYLIRKSLHEWKRISMEINMWKVIKANQLNEFRLQKLAFGNWRQYHFASLSNEMVAEDWSNLQLTQRTVRKWNAITKIKKEERALKYETAKIHERRQLLWRTLDKWRLFPSLNQIDRLREKRKEKWRHKVWEILPDYTPITDI